MADHPDQTEQKPPQAWLEALARSEADLAAGNTAPWAEVRARLLAVMNEAEAAATDNKA